MSDVVGTPIKLVADEKYAVFKREQLELAFDALFPDATDQDAGRFRRLMGYALRDAVVLRKQDVFSGPGLHAYADCMTAAIEVATAVAPTTSFGTLLEVRDYFKEQADSADAWPTKKLPTP